MPDEQGGPRFMDQLTKKIIAILRRDGRASYSDIARELDTTRDNVASRVNPLFQSGELRVIAAPHPRVLGLNGVGAHLDQGHGRSARDREGRSSGWSRWRSSR